jgi:predicted anti-sigma-YlaC factor YlaD
MSELVTDYLDGALPWHARLKARLHLLLCHACRHYYDQMRETVRFLAGAPREAPPTEMEQRLVDSMKAHDPSLGQHD